MNLQETLESLLKKDANYVNDDGNLKKWVVLSDAQNYEIRLIELLLQKNKVKNKFFISTASGALVFNQPTFVRYLEQKNYFHNNYTRYKNKIGLTIGGKFFKQRDDVALVWPYKDCVLEGGQRTEDEKHGEVFFNETLAHDEITTLLEPKVLTATRRYGSDSESPVESFIRDAATNRERKLAADTITDNLLIKGNNLLALHSIKKEFAGKVKLIYIDPPYNTGNDGFKYNDNFSHSTWLTFMKNRLEVAKPLLRDDGAIFVQCDDNEQAYLKILMDEVFGRDNFLSNVSVKMSTSAGFKMSHKEKRLLKIKESILIYAQNSKIFRLSSLDDLYVDKPYYEVERSDKYIINFEDDYSKWKLISLHQAFTKYAKKDEPKFKFVNRNAHRIFNHVMNESTKKNWARLQKKEKYKNKVRLYNENRSLYKYAYNDHVLVPYNPKILEGDLWNENFSIGGTKTHEGQVVFTNGKKREVLLKRIIGISTQKKDIVLDYHLGSGTTIAVAHKMGRQYIGIEQMDYIEELACQRLQNVINGDQSGISQAVGWQGGGSFVYVELKKHNEQFMEAIECAKDKEALLIIWEQMKKKAFFNYNVDMQEMEKSKDEFNSLSLAKQKDILCNILNKNQLYVNLSSLDDEDFACSDEDKKATRSFYLSKSET